MKRAAHFGSFDAESQWRPAELALLPAVSDSGAQRTVAAMQELSWGFAKNGDSVLTTALIEEPLRDYLGSLGVALHFAQLPASGQAAPSYLLDPEILLSPYAVTQPAHELAAQLGKAQTLPTLATVQKVNSKTFSNALAESLSLFGQGRIATSADSLGELLRAQLRSGQAVVKDVYGVSGRGTQLIADAAAGDRLVAYIRRQEERGRTVEFLVQPLFTRRFDFSCHFELLPDSTRDWGLQQMHNDGMAFLDVGEPEPRLRALLAGSPQERILTDIAQALRQAGYLGPVCVDAMVVEEERVVPLLEINARKSMGLLHLGLRRRFALRGDSALAVWSLVLQRRNDLTELLLRLREQRVLFDGVRGFLPLSSATLSAEAPAGETRAPARGRLYAMLVWDDELPRERLLRGVGEALRAMGADVKRGLK